MGAYMHPRAADGNRDLGVAAHADALRDPSISSNTSWVLLGYAQSAGGWGARSAFATFKRFRRGGPSSELSGYLRAFYQAGETRISIFIATDNQPTLAADIRRHCAERGEPNSHAYALSKEHWKSARSVSAAINDHLTSLTSGSSPASEVSDYPLESALASIP
ncbi:hypothetical protein [Thiocystis violacea]|uniref:hypothetical protein n=1 Tax=Thiocystis violacea TaxID=13725 RepID=UPI0019068C92|nr:hypothetical protein [Thiocystis violacea]MBK1724431.1 hypothetical protein [Thiocystis violacea]